MRTADLHLRTTRLDEAALDRLANALDRKGVVAAVLIGSRARGQSRPLSDVDVGVWHEPGLDPGDRLDLRLSLTAAASEALPTERVDVVLLNLATPLMKHRATRDGQLLVERDARSRVRLHSKAILDYLDTKPLRAELARGTRHRIEEGRFGRR